MIPDTSILNRRNFWMLVDTETITLTGHTQEQASVTLTVNGISREFQSDGKFSVEVVLDVGLNQLAFSAQTENDTVVDELQIIRLITDRSASDVENLRVLVNAIKNGSATQEQLAEFNLANHRGGYNYTDLNRVTLAIEYLDRYFTEKGYLTGFVPLEISSVRTDWEEADTTIVKQSEHYLSNVGALRAVLPISAPETPVDMESFRYQEANDIESILVALDALLPKMELSYIYSGEAFAGEF